MQTFKTLTGGCWNLLILLLPKTSLIRKSPSLWNLSPTNLVWAASFFHLSLPFVYRCQFANQHLYINISSIEKNYFIFESLISIIFLISSSKTLIDTTFSNISLYFLWPHFPFNDATMGTGLSDKKLSHREIPYNHNKRISARRNHV